MKAIRQIDVPDREFSPSKLEREVDAGYRRFLEKRGLKDHVYGIFASRRGRKKGKAENETDIRS